MQAAEILTAIAKIREQKRFQNENRYKRSHTPIYIPPHISNRTTPMTSRDKSPQSACLCKTPYSLPKTRASLKRCVDSRKSHQIMEYKLDAAQFMCDTFHKYKKRMFYLLEKYFRIVDDSSEISSKQHFNKINDPPPSNKVKDMLYSPIVTNNYCNHALEISYSPTFADHSQRPFLDLVNYSEAISDLKKVISIMIFKQQRSAFLELFEFSKTQKRSRVLCNLVNILVKSLYQTLINRLKAHRTFYKRTWEMPLKLDLKKLLVKSKKSEEYSSVNESEVQFEPHEESSSQYISRCLQLAVRKTKNINLSSIISNGGITQTESALNFPTTSPPATILLDKPSYEFSDTSLHYRSKVIRISIIDLPILRVFSTDMLKSCMLVSLVLENYLTGYTFEKIRVYCAGVVMKRRYRKGFRKLSVFIDSKLSLLFVRIHNVTAMQDRIERLLSIVKSKNKLAMFKGFFVWKSVGSALVAGKTQQMSECSAEYLSNTRRSLRNFTSILRNKILFSTSQCFYRISEYSQCVRGIKYKIFFVIACINRLSMSIQYQSMRKSYDVIKILHKETKIRLLALDNICKNVQKDLEFQLKICFSHWKQRVCSMNTLFLVCLSFLQIIELVFIPKRRQYFKILKTFSTNKITQNSKKVTQNTEQLAEHIIIQIYKDYEI